MSLNKILLIGAATRDVETRNTTTGAVIASFGLAVNTSYESQGQRKEEVLFVDVTAFGKSAEKIASLKKGMPIFVEGRLRLEQWNDKNTQAKRSKISVLAEIIRLCEPSHKPSQPPQPEPPPPQKQRTTHDPLPVEDDVPF